MERTSSPSRDLSLATTRAAIDIKGRHDLTEAEALRVVNEVLSGWVAGVAKVSIRVERHGDPETPGGLER